MLPGSMDDQPRSHLIFNSDQVRDASYPPAGIFGANSNVATALAFQMGGSEHQALRHRPAQRKAVKCTSRRRCHNNPVRRQAPLTFGRNRPVRDA
jgi:hypothetical protein